MDTLKAVAKRPKEESEKEPQVWRKHRKFNKRHIRESNWKPFCVLRGSSWEECVTVCSHSFFKLQVFGLKWVRCSCSIPHICRKVVFFSILHQKWQQNNRKSGYFLKCNQFQVVSLKDKNARKWTTLYPVMVLTCRRGIFHRTLKAVQFMVSSWMSSGGLSRSEGVKAKKGGTESVNKLSQITASA